MLMSSEFLVFCLSEIHPYITHLITICSILFMKLALSNSCLIFQLYVRRCILHAFQADDWACMAALLSATGFASLSLAVIEYGAGRHLANIALGDARIFYYVRSILAHELQSCL